MSVYIIKIFYQAFVNPEGFVRGVPTQLLQGFFQSMREEGILFPLKVSRFGSFAIF